MAEAISTKADCQYMANILRNVIRTEAGIGNKGKLVVTENEEGLLGMRLMLDGQDEENATTVMEDKHNPDELSRRIFDMLGGALLARKTEMDEAGKD